MKRTGPQLLILSGVVTLILLALLLRSLGPILPAHAEEPKRFQYKIIEVVPDTQQMQAVLNQFGAEGWELVAVSMGDLTAPRLVFKR
jgi:hypothetical protein